jgi:hypothetical protein
MRIIICFILFLLMATPCFASPCDDMQSAAIMAMRDRNTFAKNAINTTMPDPEAVRGAFSSCLNSISNIGAVFSFGVSIPSLDQIIASMCRQVDSMIQSKVNDVMNEARSTANEIGRNNPFQVSVGGHNVGVSISGRLR